MKNNLTPKTLTKDQIRFWLSYNAIHYIINWRAGYDCFGQQIKPFKYN